MSIIFTPNKNIYRKFIEYHSINILSFCLLFFTFFFFFDVKEYNPKKISSYEELGKKTASFVKLSPLCSFNFQLMQVLHSSQSFLCSDSIWIVSLLKCHVSAKNVLWIVLSATEFFPSLSSFYLSIK